MLELCVSMDLGTVNFDDLFDFSPEPSNGDTGQERNDQGMQEMEREAVR